MQIAVVTCGGANFYSVEMVLQRLGVNYKLTDDKQVINNSDGVILPGVGSAGYAMNELAKYDLIDTLKGYKKPLLGICLGMQLLYEQSEEDNVNCLGVLPGKIVKFPNSDGLIVPHMGWNNLNSLQDSPILKSVELTKDVYFVHSYYAPVNEVTVCSCDYGVTFAAISHRDNFYAMQFHPEKSGRIGELLLKNFIEVVNGNISGN